MLDTLVLIGLIILIVYILDKVYSKYFKPNFIKGYNYKEIIKLKQPNPYTKPKITYYVPQTNTSSTKVEPFPNYSKATLEAKALYYALKNKGVLVELEKFDGFKTIDIAIPTARINIEVDGIHHNANSDQALADLKRTYYSFLKGYYTIRIPNSLLRSNLEETAEYIAEMCNKSYENLSKFR